MIRQAQEKDFEALVRLFIIENKHHASLTPDVVRETDDVFTVQELKDILSDDNQSLLVAEIDGTVSGVLLGHVVHVSSKRWVQSRCYAYVEEIVVAPSARRKGLARALLDTFESWSQNKGATCVELHVWSGNVEAISFYTRTGFRNKQHLLTKVLCEDA